MTKSLRKTQVDNNPTPNGFRSQKIRQKLREQYHNLVEHVLAAPPGYMKISKAQRPKNKSDAKARVRASGDRVSQNSASQSRKDGRAVPGDERLLLDSESDFRASIDSVVDQISPSPFSESRLATRGIGEQLPDKPIIGKGKSIQADTNANSKDCDEQKTHGVMIPDTNPFDDSFEILDPEELVNSSSSERGEA